MPLWLGVVALCMLPFAVAESQSPTPLTGDPRKDQKGGASGAAKRGGDVAGPQDKATLAPAVAKNAEPKPLEPRAGFEKAAGHEKRPDNGGYDWNKLATVTNALATAIIAIFTWRLVTFTRRQAGATQVSATAAKQSVDAMIASTAVAAAASNQAKVMADAQLEETKRALAQSAGAQRAWLVPEPWLSSSWNLEPDRKLTVMKFQPVADSGSPVLIPLRNIGKVPAFDTTVSAKPFLVPNDGSAPIALPEEVGTIRRVLPADDAYNNPCLLSPRAGSESDLVRIADGSLVLQVLVEIEYRDPIGTEGFTAFTMLYRPNGPAGAFIVSGTFRSGDSMMM